MIEIDKKPKMLIITEGKKTEPKLLRALARTFTSLERFEIYSYKTNIYNLYDFIKPYLLEGDACNSDLLQILKEHEISDADKELLSQDYSDILLVFDFEPHDHRYDFTKIECLLEYFNESTENGKLYLNYPMVESFRHFVSNDDAGFKERKVQMDQIKNYKSIVHEESRLKSTGDLQKQDFIMIITENLKKLNYFTASKYVEPLIEEIDGKLLNVARLQNENLVHGYCYVLNTGLFFLPQFNSRWREL